MTTILLTGFGPFPGARRNPTQALVRELARHGRDYLPGVRCRAHVFATSYDAVDRQLPALLAHERPDALIMFGLAARTRHVRIETRARNALNRLVPDAAGHIPRAGEIKAGAPATLRLRVPAARLLTALRAAALPAALSVNAGDYLCNYLSWRAAEAAERDGIPRLVAFVHVPSVHVPFVHMRSTRFRGAQRRSRRRTRSLTFVDLIEAGEAILQVALSTAWPRHQLINSE